MKNESRNIRASMKDNVVTTLLVVLLLVSFVSTGAMIWKVQGDTSRDQTYLQLTADLRVQTNRLLSLSQDAGAGNEAAFAELTTTLSSIDDTWRRLSGSDQSTRQALRTEFQAFENVWSGVKQGGDTIIENKENILFLTEVAQTLSQALPELQLEHETIKDILLESGAPAGQVSAVTEQTWRLERIGRNVERMFSGASTEDPERVADQFNTDASLFGRVLDAMREGDSLMSIQITDREAIESLEGITEQFEFVSGRIRDIYEASPALTQARNASSVVLTNAPAVSQSLTAIADKVSSLSSSRFPNNFHIIAAAVIGVVLMIFIGFRLYNGTRRSLTETANTNERNQNAILRLLDELADLADGDLTTAATVTEDFTGAIADSINYTIDQLRILVSRINETAVNVSSASQETQQTALHLAEASEHQAQEIAGASAAVNEMAVTIDQVSANAAESASVAERSVSIANNGAKVVQNTIHGMDTIREQIQDTSKRIKRLGESSQEIGDIVSLINDIADQTNILALNAAIQASMAGDAGRGFAVVADEVQRLAERSAAATKQIEALVKTIQNDTNEAVISMEQTTAEVVRGARLAQDAGVALEEIENVSSTLSDLIQNISNAARQQASSAGHISNTMNVIQEITSQTSAGTSATANSIGNLAAMALDLRESVAGFTLPDEADMPDQSAFQTGEMAAISIEPEMDGSAEAEGPAEEPLDLSMESAVDDEEYDLDDDDLNIDIMSDDSDEKRSEAIA